MLDCDCIEEQLEAFTKQHHDWEMAVKALLQLLNGSHELAQLATAEGLSPDRSEDFHGPVGLACGRLWCKEDSLTTGAINR